MTNSQQFMIEFADMQNAICHKDASSARLRSVNLDTKNLNIYKKRQKNIILIF